MIFNKDKLRCLFLPPKNGTFTARAFLIDNADGSQHSGWHTYTDFHHSVVHQYPEVAIGKYPNLKNYKHYAFVRNPVDRFVSAILHVKYMYVPYIHNIIDKHSLDTTVKHMTYEQVIDCIDDFKSISDLSSLVFEPQINWLSLPSVELLDFDNYENEIRRISDFHNAEERPLVIAHKRNNFGESVVTNKVIEFVETEYAEDCKIWREYFGRRLAA
jgi:hypothetical protein